MSSRDQDLSAFTRLATEDELPPGTLVGEFRVESRLGEGGMATVYAATHPVIGKRAAIKVLSRRLCADLHAVERFVQEARTVNQIGHPNIVDIFSFGALPDGRAYFVMEWLSGETLAERRKRGPVPLGDALAILLQLSDALAAAHDKGVTHRDIKPDNVYLAGARGLMRVKLLDFGIAKLADSDVTTPRTRSGVAMGTAGYMSPEQARNKPVEPRTDVYALGCLAYEVLCGRLPFVGDSAIDILAQHLADAPPPPRLSWPDIPQELESLILRMLAKEPAERPYLSEVRQVLERVASNPNVPDHTARIARTFEGRGLGRAAVTVAAGLLLIGAAVVVLKLAASRQTAPAPRVEPTPRVEPAPVRAATPEPASAAPPPAPAGQVEPPREPAAPSAPAPARNGRVRVRTEVAGARVRIDGKAAQADQVVAPGRHRVTVTAPHRKPFEREIDVRAGQVVEVRPTFSPAAAPDFKGDYTLDPFAD